MNKPVRTLPADADEAAFIGAVEEGIADLDAVHTVPYEDVRRWLLSWGTEDELSPPTCSQFSPNRPLLT